MSRKAAGKPQRSTAHDSKPWGPANTSDRYGEDGSDLVALPSGLTEQMRRGSSSRIGSSPPFQHVAQHPHLSPVHDRAPSGLRKSWTPSISTTLALTSATAPKTQEVEIQYHVQPARPDSRQGRISGFNSRLTNGRAARRCHVPRLRLTRTPLTQVPFL